MIYSDYSQKDETVQTWSYLHTDLEGNMYEGFVNEFGEKDGPGFYIDIISKTVYEGHWKNGNRNGEGT